MIYFLSIVDTRLAENANAGSAQQTPRTHQARLLEAHLISLQKPQTKNIIGKKKNNLAAATQEARAIYMRDRLLAKTNGLTHVA